MRFLGELQMWKVTLVSGKVVDVWADAYSRDGGFYTFSAFVEIEPGEETPPGVLRDRLPNPSIVEVQVARFPKSVVRLPDGDEDWPAILSHPGGRRWRHFPPWSQALSDAIRDWFRH